MELFRPSGRSIRSEDINLYNEKSEVFFKVFEQCEVLSHSHRAFDLGGDACDESEDLSKIIQIRTTAPNYCLSKRKTIMVMTESVGGFRNAHKKYFLTGTVKNSFYYTYFYGFFLVFMYVKHDESVTIRAHYSFLFYYIFK
jgi:hypothetical protein